MATRIRVGVGLPIRDPGATPAVLRAWIERAERAGFASLAASDRVVIDAAEPLAVLAAAAGATARVRLMASVIIGPTRETTLLARQAATVDGLSGGRLTLGLAVGARADDYLASGTSFGTRGRAFDAQLALLRRIWRGEPLDVPGSAPLGPIGPRATRPDGPELLVGGYVEAVARRVAAWGDGFLSPGGGEPARMRELWRRIGEAWLAAGRSGSPRWVSGQYFALGPHADPIARAYLERSYGHDPALVERRLGGVARSREAVLELIEAHAADGVDELVLRPCTAAPEQLDRLAEAVAPYLAPAPDAPA